MARLNTSLSATPRSTRALTSDSLYRDPSVEPASSRNARPSTHSVLSPTQSMTSDKENEQPERRENTPLPTTKSRRMHAASARIPTPDSGSTSGDNGNKRRRRGTYTRSEPVVNLHRPVEQEDDESDEEEDDDDDDDAKHVENSTHGEAEGEENGNSKFYNPNQDPNQRRQIRAHMRDQQRWLDENRDTMIDRGSELRATLEKQNRLYSKVRQTADAALDSRFLVTVSALAGKKLNNALHGDSTVGIDLDQFVSKCIYFVKSGGYFAGEEGAPVVLVPDNENEEDGDGLDWALLGRKACFPSNKRPPTSTFLLGPLSVQRRVRTTQRKARSQRQPVGPVTRPQEIKQGDIQQSETSNLSTLVKSINSRLKNHIQQVEEQVGSELGDLPEEEEVDDETLVAASRNHRGAITPNNELAVNLLDFAINPRDFGQTVENLFYISFLVREGAASITKDTDGLPLLMPAKAHDVNEQREKNVQKHQAVFSIDYPTWQMFIEAFDIKEPLIPHREMEETNVGSSGWYS